VDTLTTLSDGIARLVEGAGPGVVRVEARRHYPGSGIVWSTDGVIVSADHLIEHEEGLAIGLHDGRTVAASIVGRDSTTDLAVLRIVGVTLTPAPWGTLEGARVGQLVLALARPGRTVRATLGVITAFGDNWRTRTGGQIDRYLQADARMGPGFSGGPLVDVTGKVLGLNTRGIRHRTNLTLPVPTIRRVVETLLSQGRIRRGYLGIGSQPIPLAASVRQQLGQDAGLLVFAVAGGSPAERGGVLQGDIIVTLEGTPSRQHGDLMAVLGGDRVGSPLRVRLVRGGQIQELSLVVGERE